jgi:Nucleotide modification associated domain 1
MTKDEYMKFHENSCARLMEITRLKNSDYTGGSDNPFANFEQVGHFVQLPQVVVVGFFTRMSDKFSRIGSFITKGSLLVADESVEDTLLDLANYCILLAGYLRSKKGKDAQ